MWRATWGAVLLVSLCGCYRSPATRRGMGVLGRDPQAARRLNEQGLTLLEQGRLAEAEAALRRAVEEDPYCGEAHGNLGVVLLRQNKYFDAGWELRYAVCLLPKAAAPRANLGILYEAVGHYDASQENLQQALKLAPEDLEIIGHLARLHVRQGQRTPETLAWLQTVHPRRPPRLAQLGAGTTHPNQTQ
jgi:Flp pilus assembly protein TadD